MSKRKSTNLAFYIVEPTDLSRGRYAWTENPDDTNQALKNYRSRSSSRLAKKSRFKKCILAIGTATVALAITTVVAKKNKICLKEDFKNA